MLIRPTKFLTRPFMLQLLRRVTLQWLVGTCQLPPESHKQTKPDRTPFSATSPPVFTTWFRVYCHKKHQLPCSHIFMQPPRQWRWRTWSTQIKRRQPFWKAIDALLKVGIEDLRRFLAHFHHMAGDDQLTTRSSFHLNVQDIDKQYNYKITDWSATCGFLTNTFMLKHHYRQSVTEVQ